MTESSDNPALPEADTAPDAAALAAAAVEEAARQAAEKHAADIAQLQDHHGRVGELLADLNAKLQASIDKAKSDPGHVNYAAGFLIDVEAKAIEILKWIGRHVDTAGPV